MRCADCGHVVNHHGHGADSDVRLECASHHNLGTGCTGIGTPRAIDVELAVRELLVEHLADLTADPGEQARQDAQRTRRGIDVAMPRRELEETRAARGRVVLLRAQGKGSEDAHDRADAELAAVEDRLMVRLAEAESTQRSVPDIAQVVKVGTWLIEHWDDLTGEERNEAMRIAIRSVPIGPPRTKWGRDPIRERLGTPEWMMPV
ncbi:MAG: hypothetical protein L0Y54_15810 [Sporichthyaceae bacterium]|nr:hypothetical protein [Sporichthyaceae bacterium]